MRFVLEISKWWYRVLDLYLFQKNLLRSKNVHCTARRFWSLKLKMFLTSFNLLAYQSLMLFFVHSCFRGLLDEVNHLKDRIISMKRDKVSTTTTSNNKGEEEDHLQQQLLQKEKLLAKLKSSRKSTVITPRSRNAS